MPQQQMQALFDMLDVELPSKGCDNTLRLVRHWLEEKALSVEPVLAWLRDNGGNCDCEALANSEEAWRDAIHDANT